MRFVNQTFKDQQVLLDGNEFIDCAFVNCQIRYMGITGVVAENPKVVNCNWGFAGPASNTVIFLTHLYNQGGDGRELVERTLDGIRQGKKPAIAH